MTTSFSRDLIFLLMQFLREEKLSETLHALEKESALFFNHKYFEEMVLDGDWDGVERYLLGFTSITDNKNSMKIFFEIRKHKFIETLDKGDRGEAADILVKKLKVFSPFNEETFKEMTQLLTLDNIRNNDFLSNYKDAKTARSLVLGELKRLINSNPVFREKLQFPKIADGRLKTLLNQSINWQHSLCRSPRETPDIRTLFVDHTCTISSEQIGQMSSTHQFVAPNPTNQFFAPNPRVEGFRPVGGAIGVSDSHPFQQPSTSVCAPATWMLNSLPVNHPAASRSVNYSGLAHQGTMPNSEMYGMRNPGIPKMVMQPGVCSIQNSSSANLPTDELPKTVVRLLNQGSNATSMDFHPVQQMLLLVGTSIGEIILWEICSREKLFSRNFQVWDVDASSLALKASLAKDPCVSIRRIIWNAEGSLFGVAYSKHMMQLYSYHGGSDIGQLLEIDAHVGSVNDLAFCKPMKQLCVVTCGDDTTIKVWDVTTGARLHILEGHDAPVYSVCPHFKNNIQYVFSTSMDGKIKAWLYDMMGSRAEYKVAGRYCTRMAYSADGRRLFSCGTNENGQSLLMEWEESEGTVKKTYQGFDNRSFGVIQFETSKNRFLAVGDDYKIKFWDMDNINLLTSIDAEGGLQASPRIRFSKDGNLLAVSANNNGIKVLATVDGQRLIRMYENRSLVTSRFSADNLRKNGETSTSEDVKPAIIDGPALPRNPRCIEFSDAAQFRSLRLSSAARIDKISRLNYTNKGHAILALASNGVHLYWKWPSDDGNPSGQGTTKVAPQFCQPMSGILMTNDLGESLTGEAVACFAFSKNDSYVISASGGKISLFNVANFKTLATFMSPPPAATCLAFHPQDNNIVAVGMDDNVVSIYNVQMDEVSNRLKGHSRRISGLAFSHANSLLISTGADAQIILWNSETWAKENSAYLHIPKGRRSRTAHATADTFVQFHQDQIHFLAVHESQLAIYEAPRLGCVKQWVVGESSAPLSHAAFSSDSQFVYAGFVDGALRIFDSSSLQIKCHFNPSAYLTPDVRNCGTYPAVIAANPQEPNQFAIGLTDGEVIVMEPAESEGKWGMPPIIEV